MSENSSFSGIRRIVTGHNSEGKSYIVRDENSPHAMALPGIPSFGITDIWKTTSAPARNDGNEDACKGAIELAPPKGGTVFRVVEFPPDKDYLTGLNPGEAFGSMGHSIVGEEQVDSPKHAMMHTTNSVDYAFVLKGEVWAVLEENEACMRVGDVLIQRGTHHAWSNRSSEPCIVGFVLIDAVP